MAKIFGGQSQHLIDEERSFSIGANKLAAIAIAAVAVLAIAAYFFASIIPQNFLFFFAVFISAGVFLLMQAIKSNDIKTRRYNHGRQGENDTLVELKKLPDDYLVFCGVKIGRGDIDFVVLGHTGLFAVEVKSHKGKIRFDGRELTRDSRLFEKNILNQTFGQMRGLNNYLRTRLKEDIFVIPVLVFSNSLAQLSVKNPVNNVYVLPKNRLCHFLNNGRQVLPGEKISKIAEEIKKTI